MNDFQQYLDKKLSNIKIENDYEPVIEEYDILQEVRELLIGARKESGVSQEQLSDKTGIPQANISKLENGHIVPTIKVLKKIADGLGKRLIIDFIEIGDEE